MYIYIQAADFVRLYSRDRPSFSGPTHDLLPGMFRLVSINLRDAWKSRGALDSQNRKMWRNEEPFPRGIRNMFICLLPPAGLYVLERNILQYIHNYMIWYNFCEPSGVLAWFFRNRILLFVHVTSLYIMLGIHVRPPLPKISPTPPPPPPPPTYYVCYII